MKPPTRFVPNDGMDGLSCIASYYTQLLFFILSSFILAGCLELSTEPPSAHERLPTEEVATHTVRFPGESLPMIAAWYTGSVKNSKRIHAYNGDLKRIFNLSLGTKIRIPAEIMVQSTPLLQRFAETNRKKYGSPPLPLARVTPRSSANKANEKIKQDLEVLPTPTELPVEHTTPHHSDENPSDKSSELEEIGNDELIENLLENGSPLHPDAK